MACLPYTGGDCGEGECNQRDRKPDLSEDDFMKTSEAEEIIKWSDFDPPIYNAGMLAHPRA
jgi:hypothetical protein